MLNFARKAAFVLVVLTGIGAVPALSQPSFTGPRHIVTTTMLDGDEAKAFVANRQRESAKFGRTWKKQGGRATEHLRVANYKITHNHPAAPASRLARLLQGGVLHAQMNGICQMEDCEGLDEINQYEDYWDENTHHEVGVNFTFTQEHIGEDLDGSYDDIQGGTMEFGLVLWVTQQGFLEGDLDDSSPIRLKLFDAESETELVADDFKPARDITFNVISVDQNASRTQPNKTFQGVSCDDKPEVYKQVFGPALIAAAGGFFGAGIGAIKGCAPTAATGAGYLACVATTAGIGALIGGSIAFGVQMVRMQNACSGKKVALEATESSLSSLVPDIEPWSASSRE
jgi:hypothetical protein